MIFISPHTPMISGEYPLLRVTWVCLKIMDVDSNLWRFEIGKHDQNKPWCWSGTVPCFRRNTHNDEFHVYSGWSPCISPQWTVYIYIYMYGTQDRRVQLRYKQTGSKQCKRWREPAQPSNDVWGVLQMGGPKDTIFVSILSISKYTNMI